MTRITRRALIGGTLGVVAAAGVGVPLLVGLSGSDSTGLLLRSRRPLPPAFEAPLTLPPVLRPGRTDAQTDYYDVTARPAYARILPGVMTAVCGYNGSFPGPTIEARSGRRVVVRHINALGYPTVVHLHGGRTPHDSDGYPTDLIFPGEPDAMTAGMSRVVDPQARTAVGRRSYSYPTDQRAATLWYHDHRMDFTGASVWRGLAGFHLVRDEEELALPLPRGARELPLMITDRSFDADGQLLYPSIDPTLHSPGVSDEFAGGVLGDVVLVNGRPWPYADVAAVRHRLRILNASNARRYRLRLNPPPPDGRGLTQIGSDGGLLTEPISHDAIELAPAERFDVIVNFAGYRAGQRVTLRNDFGTGPSSVVLQFRVGDPATDDSTVPDQLSTMEVLDQTQAVTTRTLLFQKHGIGTMGWRINGQAYSPTTANVTTRLGDLEAWELISDFHHPIHLHLVHFQIIERGLSGPGAYDHGWKDTIDLRPAERATILTRFEGYRGRYAFHCHNLEHEDMGMMANLVVT